MQIKTVVWLLCIFISTSATAGDYFDWSVRKDRDGKASGYMVTTPFPVDETMTTYSITNDEGRKTFNLGTIYFVDGSASGCSNGSINYNPVTRSCGSGSYVMYTNITNALAGVTPGNKTILVRSGTYTDYGYTMKAGLDDTHRFSLIGYKQERPILKGSVDSRYIITTGTSSHYVTYQRLKLQDSAGGGIVSKGVGLTPVTSYVTKPYYIDLYLYNLVNASTTSNVDAMLYYPASDGAWNYHVTAERTFAHCYKMGDSARNTLTEWSVAKECGYYSGMALPRVDSAHPVGFDYPDTGENHTLRYSIVDTGLFNAFQIRGNLSYGSNGIGAVVVHHNEFTGTSHHQDVTYSGTAPGWDTPSQAIVNGCFTSPATLNTVNFYSNIVRNSSDTDSWGLRVYCLGDRVSINNNLFYGNKAGEIAVTSGAGGMQVDIQNNTFYHSNNNPVINNGNGAATTITNNVVYHNGTGQALSVGSAGHAYNILYAPSGSIGVSLGTGEINANPQIIVPSGAYISGMGAPGVGSRAIREGSNISGKFTNSLNGVTRPLSSSWTMGAYEFKEAYPSRPIILDIK